MIPRSPTAPISGFPHRSVSSALKPEHGFTLVETLAAFAILAVVLTILLGGLSRVMNGGRHAESLRHALQLAQIKLDGLGNVEPLVAGESAGTTGDGLRWRMRVGDAPAERGRRLSGAWVEIDVFPTDGAAVSLVSFKIVEPRRP